MIELNVLIHIKQNREEDYLRSVDKHIENSQCSICHDIFKKTYEPRRFVTIEYRPDDEVMIKHYESDHFQLFLRELDEVLEEPIDFKKYILNSAGGSDNVI